MTVSTEDLARRVERLEGLLGSRIGSRRLREREDVHRFWRRIPFGAWLKISGPTFAVMALGFGLVWDAQQETTRQIMALQRETSDKILAHQRQITDRIIAHEQETAARVFEIQERILEMQESTTGRLLEMQEQILEIQRETRAGRS